MRRSDPRIRQTLNQLSSNLESANLTTQASLFSFSQNYISPCLSSFNICLEASCQPCFAALSHSDNRRSYARQRHQHPRPRREDLAFDFYDDWEQDEAEWGNDELDRLLSDDGVSRGQQPGKHGGMNYGSRGLGPRRLKGGDDDLNVVPKSSMFGFLESLPWKIGGRGVRYKPSVADLQENVGRRGVEAEPLISDQEEGGRSSHKRNRSDTVGSKSTTNSLSSRGDLFPSEDEDDAVPLDDEFAMVLERRNTGATSDDHSSRKKGQKRPSASRTSTKTRSSKEARSGGRATSASSANRAPIVDAKEEVPSLSDLKQEEERVRREEETRVEEQRQAAQRLALERGLSSPQQDTHEVSETGNESKDSISVQEEQVPSPTVSDSSHTNQNEQGMQLKSPKRDSDQEPKPPEK